MNKFCFNLTMILKFVICANLLLKSYCEVLQVCGADISVKRKMISCD